MSDQGGVPERRAAGGVRRTRQRAAISRVLELTDGPLTIDEIHERAQAELPKLGRATVYRTINLLVSAGELQQVVLPDGQTRYERACLGHHHHFSCKGCERTYDVHFCPVSIPSGTTFPGGYRVDDHELTLYGLCPTCLSAG